MRQNHGYSRGALDVEAVPCSEANLRDRLSLQNAPFATVAPCREL